MAVDARISAHRGNTVELEVCFTCAGVPADPYAIRMVEIYHTQVLPHNLVAQFVMPHPCDPVYPAPLQRSTEDIPPGDCGTEGQEGAIVPGCYKLLWEIPDDAIAPDVYFDVWSYMPKNPCEIEDFADDCVEGSDGELCHPDLDSDELSGLILQNCNRFWVYPNCWDSQDGLSQIRLGFEPLDQKFHQPEIRPLEVGIMPLPLYDFDYNLNVPAIPNMTATISIETGNKERVVDAEPMEMGIRQGSYRTNPFVFRYMIDTTSFLIGTYQYRVTVTLPDGTTRTSPDFVLTIS